MDHLIKALASPIDALGLTLFLLVFPVYHLAYPWLARRTPQRASRNRFDALRESWIERLIERQDVMAAAQQTRNLAMVNTVLVSSSLILIGFIANFLIQLPQVQDALPGAINWVDHPDRLRVKLYLLATVFALAFSLFMTSLRHLGHFVLIVGADPALIAAHEGPPATYLAALINRASHRYTLGVRCYYAAFPLFAWLFDSWAFVLLTAFWGVKFVLFQDFTTVMGRPGPRP